MVNGNIDESNKCTSLNPDEGNVKHQEVKDDNAALSSDSTDSPSSRKPSGAEEVSLENEREKTEVSHGPGAASSTTTVFCSVPLNKIRAVLGGKIEDDENSKIKQTSRKLLCLYCDRSFVSSNLRQKHVERCHSEKQSRRLSSRKLQSQFTTTACFHCDKLPVEHSLRQLFEHLVSAHSQKYFGCLLCEERFLNQLQLNDHNAKLHDVSGKKQSKTYSSKNENEECGGGNEAIIGDTDKAKAKEQQNGDKKKKSASTSKPPSRQLRKRKKTTVKTSKVGFKRSKRLQSAHNKVPVRNKKTKALESAKSEENTSKSTDKVKTTSVNPYPEFDNYYRVKKITDHSIDNLKISSLTFDDVFDKAFFNRIKCNIQENLLYHLDGKLFKNEESESRISNFEKNPPSQDVPSNSSENFGCDLSLNAVTPVTSILTPNFGEDLESQIEYGSKPSKKKLQVRQDPVRHKYVTRRKFQASIREHKENRDLSKLDMWTQLIIKDRQQKVVNGQKSAKEILEYTSCTEYKLKIQRNELNRILDRRGPFEDLKEEASKKAALEQLNLDFQHEINEECFKEVRSLMEDLLNEVAKNCCTEEKQSSSDVKTEITELLEKEDIPELPVYLKLRRTSSVPSEEEIDRSDKIALICSSQETENYELPTNTVRSKDEMVELSGEWARSRIYVCAACGMKVSNMKLLIDHKGIYHQNSWVQHYEMVGNQSELYRHLCIPGLGKVGHVEETVACKSWVKSESRVCTKCGKICNSLSELHRHILECGGDWTWMLARKKCKYRPFGARKKRRGLVKRIRVSNQKTDQTEKKKYKKTMEGPRQRPSDADTIQRMLANLPPKRSSRKSICMKDGFPRNRQKSPKNKKQVMKCGKIVRQKSTYNTNSEAVKNTSNHKNTSARRTLRNISRTLSSKILDTTNKLKVKRQLIQKMNRRSPRKNPSNVSDTNDNAMKSEEKIEKNKNSLKKTVKQGDIDRTKCVLKDKVNMKTFFPVSKRKTSRNMAKPKENENSDSLQSAVNIEQSKSDAFQNKTTKNVFKLIKKSFSFNKKDKTNSTNDAEKRSSEPIVVIEKLPQQEQPEKNQTSKKIPSKRKLRSSFKKVIDKVKKLKLDNAPSIPNEPNNETNTKPSNSFLGQGAREKEKLATVLVPLVEELKEKPTSNLAFVQNAMDNNSPTEESLIPENIFNLQHNSEDLLQAKSPMESLTHEPKTSETCKYLSAISAKVVKTIEHKNKDIKPISEDSKTEQKPLLSVESATESHIPKVAVESSAQIDRSSKPEGMSLLTVETATKSGKSPLVSPVLSPSMLSPRMKGKIRKPNRGLNDCIAMLTKKAFEETSKNEVVDTSKKTENLILDNTNEAHKIIRTNECILKIPVIESSSHIQSEVLDLSKPKHDTEDDNTIQHKIYEPSILKPALLWKPVETSSTQHTINNVKPKNTIEKQNTVIGPCVEKAILKIPKFIEMSRTNNVDNIIQGVIENYDEPVAKDATESFIRVPSVGLMNSVDKIIEEVVKGLSNKVEALENQNLVTEVDHFPSVQKSKPKKGKRKNKRDNNSLKDISAVSEDSPKLETDENKKEQKKILETKVPESVISSRDLESVQSESTIKEIKTVELNPTFSADALEEKELVTTESISLKPMICDEPSPANVEQISSEVLHENTVEKRTKKKIGERRKRPTKKAPSNKVKPSSKLEKLEENVVELNTTTIDTVPTMSQINEPDVLEEKPISAEDPGCPVVSKLKTKNNEDMLNSSEPSKLQVTHLVTDVMNESTDLTPANTDEGMDSKNSSVTKCDEEIELKTVALDTNAENDLKSNVTDSEDELPLQVLKTRNKNIYSKEVFDEIGDVTEKKEVKSSCPAEKASDDDVDEMPREECKEKCSSEITGEQNDDYCTVNESVIYDKKNSEDIENLEDIENSEKSSTNSESPEISKISKSKTRNNRKNKKAVSKTSEVRRKSPRKSSSIVGSTIDETGEPIYEDNKLPIIPVKVGSEIPEDLANEKTVEDSNVKNSQEISENEVPSDIPSEKISVSNPTDPSAMKPKNFLVDANLSTLPDTIKNSPVFSLKSNKHKKKDKNKHDSMKKKLIVKFPKIILKEPVLRIPPRDVADSMNLKNKTENSKDLGVKLILDNPFANINKEDKFSPISNISVITGKSADSDKPQKVNKKKNGKHKKKSSKKLVSEDAADAINDHIAEPSITPIEVQSNLSNCTDILVSEVSAPSNEINLKEETPGDESTTLKLISKSPKKIGMKNSRKKRCKSDKADLTSFSELVAEKDNNKFPNLEEGISSVDKEEIELSTNIERSNESKEESVFELGYDEKDQSSNNMAEVLIPKVLDDQMNTPEISNTKSENVLVQSGRNLRSTVRITCKQSDIFEPKIAADEISDQKTTKKSEITDVPCNKLVSQLEKERDAVTESDQVQQEKIVGDLSENDIFNSDLDKTDQHLLEVHNSAPIFNNENLINNIEQKPEREQDVLIEDNFEVHLSEFNAKNVKQSTKSKKTKKSFHTKKSEAANRNVTKEPKHFYISTVATKKIVEAPILAEKENENLDLSLGIIKEKPLVSVAEKDEELSFSEGELIINESFESQENNISEEKQEEMRDDSKMSQNEQEKHVDSNCTIKHGKTPKKKKKKTSSSKKLSNMENPVLKAITSLEEISPIASENFLEYTEVKVTSEIQSSLTEDLEKNIVDSSNIIPENVSIPKENTTNDIFMAESSPNYKDKVDLSEGLSVSTDANLQIPCLDINTPRRQRSAKSKALENLNIIENKLDQLMGISDDVKKPNQHIKNKASKKETSTLYQTAANESESPLKDENVYEINDKLTHRRSRAAKSKAIQNIKVLETKVNGNEEISQKPKKSHDVANDNARKTEVKYEESRRLETKNEINLYNEDSTEENGKLSLYSFETSSSKILQSNNEKNITEMEKEPFEESTKENSEFKSASEFNEMEEKYLVSESNREENELSKVKKGKVSKHKGNKKNNSEKQFQMKNTKSKTDSIPPIKNSWENISLKEELDVCKKSKVNNEAHRADDIRKNDEIDCYDIANIDDDNNLEREESTSLSVEKKRNVSKENRFRVEDTRENYPKVTISVANEKNCKSNALEHVHSSKTNEIGGTDLIDSLDVTLKTTADEISSILMENVDKTETSNSVELGEFQLNAPNGSRNNCNGKKQWDEEPQLSRIFTEKTEHKKKRNRENALEGSSMEKKKIQNMEGQTTLEIENKRRSKRACKVNTYNENELAEAIFEKSAPEKENTRKKKTENCSPDSSFSSATTKPTSTEISPQKKLNSEELFDLLKTTVPDNLIALKPVEESPSDTPITDDNFDDQYDDILRKSQELFGGKPYKKIDDICGSDDSSSNSKLTDFEKFEENIVLDDFLCRTDDNQCGDTNSFKSVDDSNRRNASNKCQEPSAFQTDDLYCDICKKSFKRLDNLVKHRTTLTHIAKLSELEAKEALNKSKDEGQSNQDSTNSNSTIDNKEPDDSGSYSYPASSGNDALKIAEIITEALEKPAKHADRGFSEVINSVPEYRRYKSLGERKSFEYDQDSPNNTEKTDINHYEPNISNTTGVILEKQITLLQNIVGLDCENSNSSYRSIGNCIGNTSPMSDISHKLEDSSNFQFPADSDATTRELRSIEGFLKPPHVEDVSEDSVNQRNTEDIKSRKVLNRDEELFLECCSLLKSGSEVSNFSKKSIKNTFLNNASVKMAPEPDILESKKVIYKVSENSLDYSRRATPLGDSFGDTSNSNTISSSWELSRNDSDKTTENFFNLNAAEKKVDSETSCSESKNSAPSTEASSTKERFPSTDSNIFRKKKSIFYRRSSKMRTKGAMKIFEGLKISIQTSESKLCSLKKNLSMRKRENRGFKEEPSDKIFESPKTPRRKSKPIKNKQQIDDRFIFKVKKKSISKDAEEMKSQSLKETSTDKISDVYDFEETQDNTDVFAKPDFKSFRSKGVEPTKVENCMENNLEAQTMSSSSSSNLSSKKSKATECITKKKHMIMGRIFRNAVKPKLDEDIRDIPTIDHNELVENYVLSCTPKHEDDEFKKPKMTEDEMNYLFDKLLDKPTETLKKSGGAAKTEHKNTGTKKKMKLKCKKRQRSNSDSTDDEFGLNKIVKKRPSRKNAKEEDNSINLEQELKECIGVASRKSQRKCTSGKQNVLVEYWSSDESAFETFLENHLQELSEKSVLPKEPRETLEKTEVEESPPKASTCEKSKKPRSKPKTSPKRKGNKESITLNESSGLAQTNRRKRTAAHPLYHWSSSSEDELQDLIEVKSLRDDPEDEYDEERPIQHGWIVGDSPKKLVTMLAQAKGKKTESESLVKEQGKKKTANS